MDREKLAGAGRYILAALKWAGVSAAVGVICGLLGTGFHWAIDCATQYRSEHIAIIWLLPAAGAVTLMLYRLCRVSFDAGTNLVITSVTTNEHIPILLAPLITAGTLLSHLFGASVGREGAALQLGGSLGHNIGELLRFDEDDVRVMSMCGMAACFSAMFGTPVSAAVFVLEVICVGAFQYSAFLPCIISSCTAGWLGQRLGAMPMAFDLPEMPAAGWESVLRVAVLAALTAVLSIVLCVLLHKAADLWARLIKNPYLRIAAGGLLMAALVTVLHLEDYAGAGAHMIERAVAGETEPWAFAVKLLLTALCVGAGFRGGEIVPTLFIGATFGCAVGPLLGLDPGFAAAAAMAALFCSVVNCPVATLFLTAELFGTTNLGLFALAIAAAFVLSGYFGLYNSQRFEFSKVKRRAFEKSEE